MLDLNKAAQLINDPYFNAVVESKASNGRIPPPQRQQYQQPRPQYQGQPYAQYPQHQQPQYNATATPVVPYPQNAGYDYSKLPPAIRESMEQQPPISYDPNTPQYLTEQLQQPTADYADNAGLKQLIAETMKEMLDSALPKIKAVKMSDGDKIQVIDTDNRVYEAVLKYKGVLRSKK